MTTPDSTDGTASDRDPHPPDYKPNIIHIALIISDKLTGIAPLDFTPIWLVLAALACGPWGDLGWPSAVMSLAFTLADGVSLALLPKKGRSFGPVTPPLLALTIVRTALIFGVGLFGATLPGWLLAAGLNLAILAAAVYATWIEPFRLRIVQAELGSPKLDGQTGLRLLHASDLHVERITAREENLLRRVGELAPDVIVLTGDYLTLSSVHNVVAQTEARDLLDRLCDAAGPGCPIYAITGSPPVDHPDIVPSIFEGLPITWLVDEVEELHIRGHSLRLAGMGCTAKRRLDAPRLRRLLGDSTAETPFTLLLYHSPDLMPEAVELGVDLYLCGHTHGGQIRLPLFGAVFTSSEFGKRYEMGRYEENGTTLYVSCGVGMEGLGAPRARFLAPPEIILWTLGS